MTGASPDTVAAARRRLADLLHDAAEVECTLICVYLFAALSMKKTVDEGGVDYGQLESMRRWQGEILAVARQEMEHLGIVANVLTAIGEAPVLRTRFDRPEATRSGWVTGAFPLEPLSLDALARFVCYEMPAEVTPEQQAELATFLDDPDPADHDGLLKLYRTIETLLGDIPEADLFVGPPSAQTGTQDIFPAAIRGLGPGPNAYGVSLVPVVDRSTALAAIAQIVDEGEGAKRGDPTCHFARFLAIRSEYASLAAHDPGFAPARPVVTNPSTDGAPGHTPVTDPAALALLELFDAAYAVMVGMLVRFFTHTDQSVAESAALQRAAFFPLMTTVIRPLAEFLTTLPASPGGEERAGPAFSLPTHTGFLPHREAAWRVLALELDALVDRAAAVKNRTDLPAPMVPRLVLLWENLVRVAADFRLRMGLPARVSEGVAP